MQKDPESLTQFVHRLRDRNVTPVEILECLDRAQEGTVRYALLLSLGEYKLETIPDARRDALLANLLQWYRDDPSPAIHSASRWVLQSWGAGGELAMIDQTATQQNPDGKKQWFVRRAGDSYLTFVIFKPGEYFMGSPDTEKGHQQNEKLHRVVISRPFAVCDQEVTKGLFQQFQRETNRGVTNIDEWSPDDSDPAVKVSWYEAILFCRWLTIKVGMSEADQCYDDPERLAKGADGFPIDWPTHFDRPGFRLPTEAEWEYACRAGTGTTYNFGGDAELLRYYAWFLNNSSSTAGHTTHTVRSLRPNLQGLFDMHGNVWEWCDDWYGSKLGYDENIPVDSGGIRNRLIRGGSWHSDEGYNRAASRYFFPPETKDNLIGLRVVSGITQAR